MHIADLVAASRAIPVVPTSYRATLLLCRRERVLEDSIHAFKCSPALARGLPPVLQFVGEPASGDGVVRECAPFPSARRDLINI